MATMFQQRHCKVVAEVMQGLRRAAGEDNLINVDYVVRVFADVFGRDNGLFDRGRFERACQLGANVKARTR